MSKTEIRREAIQRQGKKITSNGSSYLIHGSQSKAEFEQGSEGLVHLATDESTGIKYRIKCFWEPDKNRRERSLILAQQQLADLGKTYADALGGAPFDMIGKLGNFTPFAVVMKNVHGCSWKDLKEQAQVGSKYPPAGWPDLKTRATWAYGLAVAVKDMEERNFIHADLSPGNVMVKPDEPHKGDMALVDFDGFVHPNYPDLDTTIKGWEGYAAPEIYQSQNVFIGSDRIAMAVLIQEFLFVGEPDIEKDYAFKWGYLQEDIINQTVESHPHIKKKFPPIARLVEKTLVADKPEMRPGPGEWLPYLYSLADTGTLQKRTKLAALRLDGYPPKPGFNLVIHDRQVKVDLSKSPFKIRASIERDKHGFVSVVVQKGAELRAKVNKQNKWKIYKEGECIQAELGMHFFDPKGASTAVLRGKKSL